MLSVWDESRSQWPSSDEEASSDEDMRIELALADLVFWLAVPRERTGDLDAEQRGYDEFI
jgi:hypothetical protein